MSVEPKPEPTPAKKTVKAEPSPGPSSVSSKRSHARARESSRPSPRQSVQPPAKKSRRTFNSITGPEAVFDDRLPPPHADLKTPEPPSRSPTPPTLVVSAGRGNKFTPQDRDFFLKFVSWRLKENPTLSRGELCDALAAKVRSRLQVTIPRHLMLGTPIRRRIIAASRGPHIGRTIMIFPTRSSPQPKKDCPLTKTRTRMRRVKRMMARRRRLRR